MGWSQMFPGGKVGATRKILATSAEKQQRCPVSGASASHAASGMKQQYEPFEGVNGHVRHEELREEITPPTSYLPFDGPRIHLNATSFYSETYNEPYQKITFNKKPSASKTGTKRGSMWIIPNTDDLDVERWPGKIVHNEEIETPMANESTSTLP